MDMTQEDEEFNRIEMESRIKQEYIRAMRKTTREEKISNPAVYEVPTVQFMSISMDDYLKLSEELALARVLIRELGDRLSKLEKPWVGLTDEEIDQCLLRSNHALQTAGAWHDGVEWAQSQLKEKNT